MKCVRTELQIKKLCSVWQFVQFSQIGMDTLNLRLIGNFGPKWPFSVLFTNNYISGCFVKCLLMLMAYRLCIVLYIGGGGHIEHSKIHRLNVKNTQNLGLTDKFVTKFGPKMAVCSSIQKQLFYYFKTFDYIGLGHLILAQNLYIWLRHCLFMLTPYRGSIVHLVRRYSLGPNC